LITPEDAAKARLILEERGFLLHAISGRSWEFMTPGIHSGSIHDLYKLSPQRSIELHLEAPAGEAGPRVNHAERRIIGGYEMDVLPAVDLFVGQAVHLFKHISTGSIRCSHLLEFYRHAMTRREDPMFWEQVAIVTTNNDRAQLAIGFVSLLTGKIMVRFPLDALAAYTRKLNASTRLWIELYGARCVYSGFPGNKLYLLLQTALAEGETAQKTPILRSLLPRKLPPPIAHAKPDESAAEHTRRWLQQFQFIVWRLQFHVVEGLRYTLERLRWHRQLQMLQATELGSCSDHASVIAKQQEEMIL
jgi:hypothetical protein